MTDGNCPNCGAPIIAPVCDYCGTRHWGFEEVPGHPASKVTQMLSQGLITPNEAREMMGLKRLEQTRSEVEYKLAKAKTQFLNDQYDLKRLYSEAIDTIRRYEDTEIERRLNDSYISETPEW